MPVLTTNSTVAMFVARIFSIARRTQRGCTNESTINPILSSVGSICAVIYLHGYGQGAGFTSFRHSRRVIDVLSMPEFKNQQRPERLRMITTFLVMLVENEINVIVVQVTALARARLAQYVAYLIA